MTKVMFYFNVPDKIDYACRLLRKANRKKQTVGVVADDDVLTALDERMWTFSATDFVPHCRSDAPQPVRAASSIVLSNDAAVLEGQATLLHLGHKVPAGFERFERLLELVDVNADDRNSARERWRHYADRGYAIESVDAANQGEHHE